MDTEFEYTVQEWPGVDWRGMVPPVLDGFGGWGDLID